MIDSFAGRSSTRINQTFPSIMKHIVALATFELSLTTWQILRQRYARCFSTQTSFDEGFYNQQRSSAGSDEQHAIIKPRRMWWESQQIEANVSGRGSTWKAESSYTANEIAASRPVGSWRPQYQRAWLCLRKGFFSVYLDPRNEWKKLVYIWQECPCLFDVSSEPQPGRKWKTFERNC